MANYKGHVAGGLGAGLVYVMALHYLPGDMLEKNGGIMSDWQTIAGFLVISMLFSLWPDIDTNSKGQDIFYGSAFLINVLLIAFGYIEAAAYFGLICMIPILGKHRGWTHSKWAMILVPLPIVIVPYINKSSIITTYLLYYGAAVLGIFSHLLLDGRIIRKFRIRGSRA